MKTLIFIMIFVFSMHAYGELKIEASIIRLPSGNYQCTLTNKGESVIFGDPENSSDMYLLVDLKNQKGAIFQFSNKQKSSLNKHLILLTNYDKTWPGNPDAYTYKFAILSSKLLQLKKQTGDKFEVSGIRLWVASTKKFKDEGIKAFRFIELHNVAIGVENSH